MLHRIRKKPSENLHTSLDAGVRFYPRTIKARLFKSLLVLVIIGLSSCGGDASAPALPDAVQLSAQQNAAPDFTGDVARDGLNWFNFRRQQAGLATLSREPMLDAAATAHARYQQQNNLITHDQDQRLSGFSGEQAPDRLMAAGYPLRQQAVAEGEVVGASTQADGFALADGLLTAIYHRYVILEPVFDQAGAGTAARPGGYTWLTVNFVASQNSRARTDLPLAVWPSDGQSGVRTYFLSDQEIPDPVPAQDRVGYPVSVHAPMFSRLRVDRFTISEPEGESLPVRLLDPAQDIDTPGSAAAIVPLQPLRPGRLYRARFDGSVNDQPLVLQWSFTTQ